MSVTTKCDVYSFGVVALETMMGHHPGEFISTLTKPSTQQLLVKDVLDPRIPLPKSRKDMQDVVHVVKLALACLSSDPKSRPSMQVVANEFLASKAPIHNFGNIPEEISALTQLTDIRLQRNQVSGFLPSDILVHSSFVPQQFIWKDSFSNWQYSFISRA
ncbi:hypothetical protein AHAS_Ahas02G0225100 [Arachis hypogaea]